MSKILVPICLLVITLLFFCDDSTSPPEPEPIVFEGICGDVNGDREVNVVDVTSLISYLFHDRELVDTSAGDVDDIRGVNHNDLVTYFEYLYAGGELLNCTDIQNDTVLPISQDSVYIAACNIAPNDSNSVIYLHLKPIQEFEYLALSLEYSSNLDSVICDSLVISKFHSALNPGKMFDWGESLSFVKNSMLHITFHTDSLYEKIELATLYFSFQPKSTPGYIFIDTTTIAPSNITILSRYNHPHTIAYKPVIVFE